MSRKAKVRVCSAITSLLRSLSCSLLYLILTSNVSSAQIQNFKWPGLIGVNYNPNHYPKNHIFNNHDVFFTRTIQNNAVSNVYTELSQLKAAGFKAIRSYQTQEYSWIEIIKCADQLGLKIIYEASIPTNGDTNSISSAVRMLTNVIKATGNDIFGRTVIHVFAGHENYNGNNTRYLMNAIEELKTTLINNKLNYITVGTALVSGNLVTPGTDVNNIQDLIFASSKTAPLGFDPYPFQWGVTPPKDAVSNVNLQNSIAWDYAKIAKQPFPKLPILMAESGWSTEGIGDYNSYVCSQLKNCKPSVENAAIYLAALYEYVRNTTNNAAILAFAAYDEPWKEPKQPDNLENHYGLFDSNCYLKKDNLNLLPNTRFENETYNGCKGYISGATFSVVGTQPGAETNQPPFIVRITQTNPVTKQDFSLSTTIPKQIRTNQAINSWPYFLVFDRAVIKITGVTSRASCEVSVNVANSVITWGKMTCTNPRYIVNCKERSCYLPWKDF